MICAKTKMKKLPESCNKCTLSNLNGNYYSDLEKHPNAEKSASGHPYVCARTLGYCKKCDQPEYNGCTHCWNELLE